MDFISGFNYAHASQCRFGIIYAYIQLCTMGPQSCVHRTLPYQAEKNSDLDGKLKSNLLGQSTHVEVPILLHELRSREWCP